MATQKFSNTPISSRPQPSSNGPQGGPWNGCKAFCFDVTGSSLASPSGIVGGAAIDIVLFTQDLPTIVEEQYELSGTAFFGATQITGSDPFPVAGSMNAQSSLPAGSPITAVRDAAGGVIGEYATSGGISCYGYAFSSSDIRNFGWTIGNGGPAATINNYGIKFWAPGLPSFGSPIQIGSQATILVEESALTQEMLDTPRVVLSGTECYIAGIWAVRA